MKTKHFQTDEYVNISHCKDMWEFLTNHFTYWTMNSWNGLESIANKVKVWYLPFKHTSEEIFEMLEATDYATINSYIEDWEKDHPEYKVGFNGRSAGYLVLYNEDNNDTILQPSELFDWDTYEDFKEYAYGDIETYYKPILRKLTKLVKDFDKLCDDLIDVCDETCDFLKEERE